MTLATDCPASFFDVFDEWSRTVVNPRTQATVGSAVVGAVHRRARAVHVRAAAVHRRVVHRTAVAGGGGGRTQQCEVVDSQVGYRRLRGDFVAAAGSGAFGERLAVFSAGAGLR